MAMKTDAAALSAEASHFEQVSTGIQGQIRTVESIGAELRAHWVGAASQAGFNALGRFHDAAESQVKQLEEIFGKIREAGVSYESTQSDAEQAIAASTGDMGL
jgi:WXG100 family type VII secretion target